MGEFTQGEDLLCDYALLVAEGWARKAKTPEYFFQTALSQHSKFRIYHSKFSHQGIGGGNVYAQYHFTISGPVKSQIKAPNAR